MHIQQFILPYLIIQPIKYNIRILHKSMQLVWDADIPKKMCFEKRDLCFMEEMLKGTSRYGRQVERTLDKYSLRGQGISPLNYMNCGV
jgi:hypothetical protein